MGKNRELSNHEIVTLAVYLLGGATKPIDTEDIAIKANALAPGRYTWRKYPDQINIELIRAFLSDAKKPKNGGYLSGSGNHGWMLTEAGFRFSEANIERIQNADLSRERKSQAEKNWFRRERKRMLSSDAYKKFHEGRIGDVTAREAASFFRIDEYVTGEMRERKLSRIINEFGTDRELGDAVNALAARVREDNRNE